MALLAVLLVKPRAVNVDFIKNHSALGLIFEAIC